MKAEGKEAFGGALLISDAAASRKAVAEQTIPHSDTPTRVWSLSEREMKIVEELIENDDKCPCAVPLRYDAGAFTLVKQK